MYSCSLSLVLRHIIAGGGGGGGGGNNSSSAAIVQRPHGRAPPLAPSSSSSSSPSGGEMTGHSDPSLFRPEDVLIHTFHSNTYTRLPCVCLHIYAPFVQRPTSKDFPHEIIMKRLF